MTRTLIIGASGGIGAALAAEAAARGDRVTGLSRRDDGVDVTDPAAVASIPAQTEPPRSMQRACRYATC